MTTPPPRVLVIDDEKPIQQFLRICLETEGYEVVGALTAADGLREVAFSRPDLVLLDVNLPDQNGYDVLSAIREWSRVPIIVLTVVGQEQEKIRMLDKGADDYITKPFATGELLARIRAALRHRPEPEEIVLRTGWLAVDFSARSVTINGKPVKLTRIEYNLLRFLGLRAGKVVTQTQIMKEIWGPGSEQETNVLRVHVAYLRKKIEKRPEAPDLLVTEPAVGYRLNLLPPD